MSPDQLLGYLLDGLDPRHEVQMADGPHVMSADAECIKAVVYLRSHTGKRLRVEVARA